MMQPKNWIIGFLALALLPDVAAAVVRVNGDGTPRRSQLTCEALNLNSVRNPRGEATVIPSGRDGDTIGELEVMVQEVAEVAHSLGYAVPPHQVNFVASQILHILVASASHAAPHWSDGHEIATQVFQRLGVYEFVMPGCPMCRSYNSDVSTVLENMQINAHVAGHNHVFETHHLFQVRRSDPMAASQALARALQTFSTTYDPDEVALFYQGLKSMTGLQDFFGGTHESVGALHPERDRYPDRPDFGGIAEFTPRNPYDARVRAWNESPSVLQALVSRLPEDAPHWKRELIRLFEEAHRWHAAFPLTQVIHEGFATQSMYLIARHMRSPQWRYSGSLVEFAQLLHNVVRPDYKNPYWLGIQGFQNLYNQFQARPELNGVDPVSRDNRYVNYTTEIFQNRTQMEWLRVSLTRDWVERQSYILYRQAQPEELDPARPPEQQRFIALTRDRERIVEYIIRHNADMASYRPRLYIQNRMVENGGVIELRHAIHEGHPLEPTSAFKTMYVMARTMGRPVLLHTRFFIPQAALPEGFEIESTQLLIAGGQPGATFPARVRVDVDGRAEVNLTVSDEQVDQAASAQFTHMANEIVQAFRADMLATYNPDLAAHDMQRWGQILLPALNGHNTPLLDVVQHAPGAGAALHEYSKMVERRMARAVELALQGRQAVRQTATGVKLKVVPEIPSFNLVQTSLPSAPAPVDPTSGQRSQLWNRRSDDNGVAIGSAPYLPGQTFGQAPPEQPPQNGQGQGEGQEGQPQPGQGQPQPGQGQPQPGQNPGQGQPQPGGGQDDPNEIEIPLKVWGELLIQGLDLPNIRRTTGSELEMRRVRRGSMRRQFGNERWARIIGTAITKAQALYRARGIRLEDVEPRELIRTGLAMLTPEDIVVDRRVLEPRPDFDAVLVTDIDLTGSMTGLPMEIAKNLSFNVRAMLEARYPNVIRHYVGIGTGAREFSEEEIWKANFGSSTAYAPAMDLNAQILSQYPNARYNKYVLLFGDLQTYDVEAFMTSFQTLAPDLQYFGMALTGDPQQSNRQFVDSVLGHRRVWPWVGYAEVPTMERIMDGLRRLFPKGEPEGEPQD